MFRLEPRNTQPCCDKTEKLKPQGTIFEERDYLDFTAMLSPKKYRMIISRCSKVCRASLSFLLSIANRLRSELQRMWSTLAGRSATSRRTNVTSMNANRAIRIATPQARGKNCCSPILPPRSSQEFRTKSTVSTGALALNY